MDNELEFDSEYGGFECFDIRPNSHGSANTITVKLRRKLAESNEEFKEIIDYLGKTVNFLIHIATDQSKQIQSSGHFWVKPKNMQKTNEMIAEITMEYDSEIYKNLVDLWKHDCVLFMSEIITQPEIPMDHLDEEE